MFRENVCDKVSIMKNLRLLSFSFFRALRRGVLRFFCRRILNGENHETKSPVFTFLKNGEKRLKVRGEMGGGNRKKSSPSHPSSSAVGAGRFGPPNFFRRPPESGLIAHTSCII